MLLAQAVFAGWGIAHWAIAVIVILAVVAIVVVFVRQTGLQIPPFIVTIFWILLAAFVCIAAIKFLMAM